MMNPLWPLGPASLRELLLGVGVAGPSARPAAEATENGHAEVAQVLLKGDASVDKVDGKGVTPLTGAAW